MQRAMAIVAMLTMGVAGCAALGPDGKRLRRPLPYAAILKPPPAGQPEIMLLGAYRGRFVINDRCVRMKVGQTTYTPVFYHGTVVGRDAQGTFVKDPEAGAIFRDGDLFAGGGALGGPMPDDTMLSTGPVPPQCPASKGTLNPGFQHR